MCESLMPPCEVVGLGWDVPRVTIGSVDVFGPPSSHEVIQVVPQSALGDRFGSERSNQNQVRIVSECSAHV